MNAKADESQSSVFQQGLSDREQWEAWISGLTGPSKEGANYWAGKRNSPNPGTCDSLDSKTESKAGCIEAQKRLSIIDTRRKNEPEYKKGFNSYTVSLPTKPPAEEPSQKTSEANAPSKKQDGKYNIGQSYTTTGYLSFGCSTPENAAAIGQKIDSYSGGLSTLTMEANANDCFYGGRGLNLKLSSIDEDSGSMLMQLPKPTYILGRGKITELWFSPNMFKEIH